MNTKESVFLLTVAVYICIFIISTSSVSFSENNIELTGIMGGDNPSAIVNDTVVTVGDRINGVKIIEITDTAIKYEHNGKIHSQILKHKVSRKFPTANNPTTASKATDRIKKPKITVNNVKLSWEWINYTESLYTPVLNLDIKNISSEPLESLSVRAVFFDKKKKEVLGEGYEYIVSSADIPLKPYYSKSASLSPYVGYKHCPIRYIPAVEVDLYVNDEFYKQVKMPSKDWSSVCIMKGGRLP